jgi:hypothetical protein
MKRALIIPVLLISLMLIGIEVQINLDHLEFLRDHFAVEGESEIGYWIYADRLPDGNYRYADAPGEGVTCVDDVARAAVLYLRLFEISGMEQHYDRAKEALEFVLSMQDSDGDFYNFVFEDGRINRNGPTSRKGGNWWAARALWALTTGARISRDCDPEFSVRLTDAAHRCFRRIINFEQDGLIQGYTDLSSVVLLGAAELYAISNDALVGSFIKRCAAALQSKVIQNEDSIFNGLVDESSPSETRYFWHGWGSRQLEALAVAGEILGNDSLLEISAESFKQSSMLLINAGPLYSISSYLQLFPQIAYAAESAISAGFRLYHLTGDRDIAAITALLGSWFLGVNKLSQSMIGKNGEGFDGLEFSHINMNAGAESTISMLLSLERIRRLPSEFERFFSEDVEILTPVEIIEAESMRAGLSEIEVVQSAGVSGNAVMKISGAFSLRLSVTLAEASYSVFAALNEVRSKTAVFTVKLGDSRSEKTVEMSEKTIVKIGTVSGTGKETTLTVGGRVTEGSFDLDQIILVPDLAAVYLIKDNESLILNFKEHAGIDKGLSFENGRIYERERKFAEVPSVAVDTIEDGNLLHLDLRELFNNNGIAASDERKIANFDNPQGLFGASFISSELEKNLEHGFLSVGNTRFVVNIEGDDNFRLIGQAIELSAEVFDKICILGSANHGDYFGEALLIYEDNSQQTIPVSFSDWCGGPSTGEKIAFEFSGRYDNTGNTERIKCMLYYRCVDLLDKPLKGIVLPQMPNVHVFAISLSRAGSGSRE